MDTFFSYVGLFVAGIVVAVIMGLLLGFPLMWLWNALMPALFGLPTITFWQAAGLYTLCGLLFNQSSGSSSKR